MATARIGQYEIHYHAEGVGTPVVLIHGLAGDHSAWLPLMERLSRNYQVIAFDNRGAGKSTQLDEPISTLDMAHDTIGLLEHLDISNAHIVGRSMGGAIAQHIALERPNLVRSLVLCASFAKLDPLGIRVLKNMREALEWRGSWRDHARHSVQNFVGYHFFNSRQDVVAQIEALIGGEERLPACYSRQNQACLEHNTLDRIVSIECPTLIMGGANDPICSPTATSWMSERIPRSKTVFFDGCSHFFLIEQAETFANELAAWLSEN